MHVLSLANSMTLPFSQSQNIPSLCGKRVLITGAAGRLGSAAAIQSFNSGATVYLTDIAADHLTRVHSSLAETDSSRVFSTVEDISTDQGLDNLFSKIADNVKSLDCAVHCAYPRSAGWGTPFEDLSSTNLFSDLNSQLGGAILLSKRIVKVFQDNGGGSLVHLSSVQGIQAPKFSHYVGTSMTSPIEYAAIKSGVISITRWLAKYYSNQNIRVNCVSPGGILADQPKSFCDKYRDSCTNIGMLSPSHVASMIVYLLSSSSVAINGQNIVVDDGWTL